jgi:hypothetical protein
MSTRPTWVRVGVVGLMLAAAVPALGQAQGPIPRALGDPAADLVFSPVAPCRIVDTRLAGGPIAADTQRSFVVTGTTDFEAQGGTPGGCGIPDGAAAVVVNFVAVGPAGPGDLRAFPFGQPVPLASIINYASLPGLNVANGVAVPLCAAPGPCPSDLTVQADVSATHLVADVLGFYQPVAAGGIGTILIADGAVTAAKLAANAAWSPGGNAGTVAGTNFLGTTDDVALELRANNARALRLEPASDATFGASPNVIGGADGNTVAPGVFGATIAGGGSASACAGPCLNQVTANFGTVGGGRNNTASGDLATVGGGVRATASGPSATVGGGQDNTASKFAATVAGGLTNTASGVSATVGGGFFNTAGGADATVPGGSAASASLHGQMAYASGAFGAIGDAQSSLFVLRKTTTDNVQTELFLDGFGGAPHRR